MSNAPNHISDTQLWNWMQQEQEPGLELAFDDHNSVPQGSSINLNILFELRTMNNLLQLIAKRLDNASG